MNLLFLGANSDMALAIARKFADAERADVVLASRDLDRLEKRARDLEVRYRVRTEALFFDACDYGSHQSFYEALDPRPDGVVLAFGAYADQSTVGDDLNEARHLIRSNFTGAVSILGIIAADFEKRGNGFIIGISSVAGERGRQSNYVYGAAKAGFTVFLAGLRNRLHRRRVRVMTVLPGFVRTKMTEGLDLPGLLTAEPEQVAGDVYRAYLRGKDIVYTRPFWRIIMFLIRITPEAVFKRLRL